jgi:hypothetical protein
LTVGGGSGATHRYRLTVIDRLALVDVLAIIEHRHLDRRGRYIRFIYGPGLYRIVHVACLGRRRITDWWLLGIGDLLRIGILIFGHLAFSSSVSGLCAPVNIPNVGKAAAQTSAST